MGTLTKIGKPIKFEIGCQNEAEADRIHDEIATDMKKHGWEAPIQIWTDMPNSDPNEIFYYVRVGDWTYDFFN